MTRAAECICLGKVQVAVDAALYQCRCCLKIASSYLILYLFLLKDFESLQFWSVFVLDKSETIYQRCLLFHRLLLVCRYRRVFSRSRIIFDFHCVWCGIFW